MKVPFRLELRSVQNGEVYSVYEFTLEAPTTLQAAHDFDDAMHSYLEANDKMQNFEQEN